MKRYEVNIYNESMGNWQMDHTTAAPKMAQQRADRAREMGWEAQVIDTKTDTIIY